jgi:subtilisin family serine protease
MKIFYAFAISLAVNAMITVCAHASQRIITFSEEISRKDRILAVEKMGGVVIHELELLNAVAAKFPDRMTKGPSKDSDVPLPREVISYEEDFVGNWLCAEATSALNDLTSMPVELFNQLEIPLPNSPKRAINGERVPWGVTRVGAPQEWKHNTGNGVKVAVIDSGADLKHPDLKANIAGGYNFIKPGSTPQDNNGHGTHVTGIIAAAKNGIGIVGVAPNVKIYALKVVDDQNMTAMSDVIAAIEWAIKNKMQVINISLAYEKGSSSLQTIIRMAKKAGIIVICGAGNGNGGRTLFPAAYPEAVAVTASTADDMFGDFSSLGPEVDFIAPGVDIDSTATIFDAIQQKPIYTYRNQTGTSMATPHVSGLAALAIVDGADTPDKVLKMLKLSAIKLRGLADNQQGAGLPVAGWH